jgi:hypothetical protein
MSDNTPAPPDLAAIRARLAAIRPREPQPRQQLLAGGAWFTHRVGDPAHIACAGYYGRDAEADAAFDAAAPADIAALLAEVDRLRALVYTRRARYAGKRDYAADQLAYATGNERDSAFWSGYREACQAMLDDEQP